MELKAFSVRDLKAGAYSAPYFAPSLGEGERIFAKLARDPQTNISQFAEDFELFYVGVFEDHSAQYKALDAPQPIATAIQFKQH